MPRHDGEQPMTRVSLGSISDRLPFAAVIGALIVGIVAAIPTDQTIADGIITAAAVLAALAWTWRVMRIDSARAGIWGFFAAGYAFWASAESIWFGYDLFAGGGPPQPSVADPLYMLGYVFIAIGLVRLVMRRGRRAARASALDALALTIAAGTILVQLELLAPNVFQHGVNAADALAIIYAILDVPLLGGIAWLLLSPGRRGAPLVLMIGAFGAMYMADVAYAIGNLYYALDVRVSNFAYPVAYLLAAAAALHPSIVDLGEPGDVLDQEDHATRLVFLALALVMPATLQLFAPLLGLPPIGVAGAIVTISVSVVILFRMARLLKDNNRARARAREAHESLHHQATRDHLTGLFNRGWAVEHLEHLLGGIYGEGQFALLYIDLDGFKLINDDLGHDAGDELLRLVADRLSSGVRAGDSVVRLGGDEFVAICPPQITSGDAEGLAARIVGLLSERFQLGAYEVNVTASVGVLTAFTHAGVSPADLLRDADIALYRAKEVRSTWRVFNSGMRARSENRLEILTHLRGVIRSGRLRVVYQPVVDLASGRVQGVEALARLTMPDGREIPPPVFVGIAESTGAASLLDAAVVARALDDLAWLDERCPVPLTMSINLSASEVAHPELAPMIHELLETARIDPRRLILEVTETAVVKDLEAARMQLEHLRELGVGIEIDDFGTGYSSMAYLHSLPVTGIKIDRSFVQGVFMDPNQALMTEGMVRMGNALGLRVIGEGIEQAAQSERMLELGCDSGQGYFFGRPMAREAVAGCIDHEGRLTSGKRSSGSVDAGSPDDPVESVLPTVGVPLVVAQITERRDYASGLDDKLKKVSLDRVVGPPAILNDPLVANGDDPPPAPRDLDGMGHA
jgi:diguanylate cyclase (GGDEF)-like protein